MFRRPLRLVALIFALLAPAAVLAADKVEMDPIDQVLGKADAPITIIEYASTTCGHCATFHKTILPRIKSEWIDTGKARLIYRDLPTGPAALSVGASMIAHCAGPERYFGLLGYLFAQQDRWMSSKNPLDELKRIAAFAGMAGEQVDACLKRSDLAQAIQARAQKGTQKYGVDSTPTLVIDGKTIAGPGSYEQVDQALKAASK